MKRITILLLSITVFMRLTAQDAESIMTVGESDIDLGINKKSDINLTQSVSRISSDEIETFNANSPYQMLYGTLSGLTALQDLGWTPSARLFVRGGGTLSDTTPLIVVDGFPRKLDMLSGIEIESITVLKDGAATALWGAQGANGVIVITTKRGSYQSMKTTIDYKFGMGFSHDMPEFVDAATYARATNEALINDGYKPRYSDAEINNFQSGIYPDLYPNVDWLDSGLRDYTTNHQVGITFSGGGSKIKYFTAIDYQNELGLLDHTDFDDRYSTQMRRNKLSLRVNMDVDITESTKLQVGLQGALYENQRPTGAEADIIGMLYQVPSLAFPIKTSSGAWGSNDYYSMNPIAKIADSGFYKNNRRQLQANINLRQDFSMWVKGLSADLSIAWDNMAAYEESQKKNYLYEINVPVIDDNTGELISVTSNQYGENGTLVYSSNLASQYMYSAVNARIGYDRTFTDHAIDAVLAYRQESNVPNGRNTTRRYQSLLGTVSYGYDNKYFIDAVMNYYGASVLLEGSRFSAYPAVSAAWLISNEKFMNVSWLDMLKLRLSWGKSGLTDFGYELDKHFYVQGANYWYGSQNSQIMGYKESALPVTSLVCEKSNEYNVGLDLKLFKKFSFTIDGFYERRSDILLSSTSLYSTVIGITTPELNTGIVDTKGIDANLNFKDQIGDWKYNIGGTFSFARTNIVENNEGNVAEPYLSKKGDRLGQFYGLEAIGFFNDWEDIENSYEQRFSSVRPGDVKYKDQNGDKVIDSNDFKALGYSTLLPEIYYGINAGLEWNGLGFMLQFQGVNHFSTVLNTAGIYRPMANSANLSTWYMEDNVRWTEETKNEATLPRLSTYDNKNNNQNSSLWLADASYFKLRNAYLYYSLPKKIVSKIGLSELKVYARGENLFSLDKIDYSNPENVGTLYPDIRQFSLGLNVKF